MSSCVEGLTAAVCSFGCRAAANCRKSFSIKANWVKSSRTAGLARRLHYTRFVEGAIMKNIITEVMAIATLTTSMSAFAASGKAKTPDDANSKNTDYGETVVICPVDSPNSTQDEAKSPKDENNSRQQQKIKQQDQQWLRALGGIYGG
jgi:hypothetical protein